VKGDQAEFDRAVDYFERARQIYEELGDRINAVIQTIRLGHVRRGQNDLKAAKDHYEDAMQRYHDLNYSLGEGDIAMELGQVNVSLGEWEEADEHFKRAKGIHLQFRGSLFEGGSVYRNHGSLPGSEAKGGDGLVSACVEIRLRPATGAYKRLEMLT
jgi:tetratricopeptide (TPR) repeat protein